MSISAKDKTVDLSKLKSYYQVNEMVSSREGYKKQEKKMNLQFFIGRNSSSS